MKTKKLAFIVFSAFFSLLLVGFASATVSFVNVTNNIASVEQGDSITISFAIEESNYGNLTNLSFNIPLTLDSGSNTLVSQDTISGVVTSLSQGETSGVMALVFSVSSTKSIGTYRGNLTLTGDYVDSVSYVLPIEITVTEPQAPEPNWKTNFCVYDEGVSTNPGKLNVRIKDVTVANGFGDDNEWLPFDEIEVEVNIENNGNDDVNDISLEWGLYDEEQEKWVIEVDNEKDFDVKDGDDEALTLTFSINDKMDIDLEDLDDGKHYALYVRATGEVDNDDNDDTCNADTESIDLIIERDFVIVANIDAPETISCGQELTITADVWNIGSKDQDNVMVRILNKELGIDSKIEVGDINSFDSENLDFTFMIPKTAKEKSYILSFEVYDEDNDIYVNDYDDESVTTALIKVDSCSTSGDDSGSETPNDVLISANLESGGFAGEILVIKAMITNSGTSRGTFLLNVAGYAGWADSVKLDKETVVLDAGDSEEVTIVFNVKKDATGDQLFKLEVVSGGELVASQPISVSIEQKQFNISSSLGDNWYLWLIGLLNVILIVIIIVIAVKVAKK